MIVMVKTLVKGSNVAQRAWKARLLRVQTVMMRMVCIVAKQELAGSTYWSIDLSLLTSIRTLYA